MALSNIVRLPVALIVEFGGAIAYFADGNFFWGIIWLVILGPIVAGIVALLIAVPFFLLGLIAGAVWVATRFVFGHERKALARLPFEVRRRDR